MAKNNEDKAGPEGKLHRDSINRVKAAPEAGIDSKGTKFPSAYPNPDAVSAKLKANNKNDVPNRAAAD